MTGGILSLDISTVTGWAYASAEALAAWPEDLPGKYGPIEGVVYNSQRMGPPSSPLGRYCLGMHDWLNDMLTLQKPHIVVFEAPLPRPVKGTALNVGRLLMCLAGMAETVAYANKVECDEEAVSTVRKHFTGAGNLKKADVRFVCRQRGWSPKDNDAADALALLDLAAFKFRNRFRQ